MEPTQEVQTCMSTPRAEKHAGSITLTPNERVVAMQRDWSARGKVYTVRDRHCSWLLLTQWLPLIADFINESVARDAFDYVNVTSLYEAKDKRMRCGLTKGTWAVDAHASYAEALAVFERSRPAFETAAIVGTPAAYRVEARG